MEGLAKSAPKVTGDVPDARPQIANGFNTLCYDTVPIDIYRQFDLDLANVNDKVRGQLKDIFNYAYEANEQKSVGNAMTTLRNLEVKLGSPRGGESRIGRIYNWVKLSNQIQDLDLRRNALRGVWH